MTIHAHANQDVLDLITSEPGSVNPDAVAKFWVRFDGTGTIAIDDSFNVSGLVDNGTGDYSITLAIDFDNPNYSAFPQSGAGPTKHTSFAVGAYRFLSVNSSDVATDSALVTVTGFGDMVNLSVGGSAPGVKVESLCKGWISFDGTGTIAINDSFNVLSIVDIALGSYDINWVVDFDNADYPTTMTSSSFVARKSLKDASSVRCVTFNSSGSSEDGVEVMIQAFGDNPIALSTEAGFNFGEVSVLSNAATVTIAVGEGENLFTLATTQDFTLNTPTGVPVGKSYKADIRITQDGTGSRILTLQAGWLVDSGTTPVLSTDPAAVDLLSITYDGTSFWIGLAIGDGS